MTRKDINERQDNGGGNNPIIRHFETIDSGYRRMKFATVFSLCVAAFIALGSVGAAIAFVSSRSENVYVLDRGSVVAATAASGSAQRDLEVEDHFTRFCELFFNLAPSQEAIENNINRALEMCDRSAYEYYDDQKEQGFYQRIVSANISEQFVKDSCTVNVSSYPYSSRIYGKIYVVRESNVTAFDFEASCRLRDVTRSTANPHGLMMENFSVSRMDKIGTRKRR